MEGFLEKFRAVMRDHVGKDNAASTATLAGNLDLKRATLKRFLRDHSEQLPELRGAHGVGLWFAAPGEAPWTTGDRAPGTQPTTSSVPLASAPTRRGARRAPTGSATPAKRKYTRHVTGKVTKRSRRVLEEIAPPAPLVPAALFTVTIEGPGVSVKCEVPREQAVASLKFLAGTFSPPAA